MFISFHFQSRDFKINFFTNIIILATVYLGILIITREPLFKDLRNLFRFSNN